MKYLISSLIYLFAIFPTLVNAQMPHAFKYQGLARNQSNAPIKNTSVNLMMSIISDQPSGTVIYKELHQVQTNNTGLFSLAIGTGQVQQGIFNDIPWSDGVFYLQVELDTDGTGAYEYAGTSPLLAVPFAMHAYSAEQVDDADADPYNEIQQLSFDSTTNELSISNGNTIPLYSKSSDADSDPYNELQTLSKTGNKITLSDGGEITDAVEDADADPANEIQLLTFDSTTNRLTISGGNSISLERPDTDGDSDPSNELQTITKNGNTITLSGGGSVVDNVEDADADPSNELQKLSIFKQFKPLAPLSLHISDGNQIDLPLTSPWNFSTKDDRVSQISTTAPVITDRLYSQEIEVTKVPGGWDYPLINMKEYQFRTAFGATGMRMSKNRLAYHYKSDPGKYNMYLDNKSIRFYNTSEWLTSEFGGSTSGIMKLYSGLSSTPYFQVEKIGTRARLTLSSIQTKQQLFTIFDNELFGTTIWYGKGSSSVIIGGGTNGLPGNGFVQIYDNKSTLQAGMYINGQGKGVLFADIKNFVEPHPKDPEKEIVYASLEGPEAAIYERGTSILQDGKATVHFSEHFALMLAQESMTVQLTPLSASSMGLSIIEKTGSGFTVKELHAGEGNYSFDWEVKAVRKGYEDFKVIRKKSR